MLAARPLDLGTLSLPHRLLVAPLKTARCAPGGEVTDDLLAFYRQLARGGAAMVITEPCAVLPSGREHPRQLAIHEDRHVAGLARVVETLHRGGALACCHLNHAGRAANPKAGGVPLAPSPASCPTTGQEARALTEQEIREIVAAFREGARRAREAGYDAIEVQLGHGYLVAQFLSPRTNRRDDAWGGDVGRRLRFAREVLAAVREGAGALPVIARVSASEMVEGGLRPADLAPLLALLEELGVAAVHAGMGNACEAPPWYYGHMALPEAPQDEAIAGIAGRTRLPVIAAGRMGDPDRIERLLAGPIEAVALGRAMLADPEFPRKMLEGKADEIVACGGCLAGCLAEVKAGRPLGCIVNPRVGRPDPLPPAERAKKVLVAGGGPAGIAAALFLAERGHRVILCEEGKELGGQFALAWRAPGKERMRRPLAGLVAALRRSPVEVRLETRVTPELAVELAVDEVIVATGARPVLPPVPGLAEAGAITGVEYFARRPALHGRVLVLGGGMIGMEAAETIAEDGAEVLVVELLDEIARDMEPITRKLMLGRIARLPIEVRTGTRLVRVEDDGVLLEGSEGKEERLPPFDAIVVAVGTRPRAELAEELERRGIPHRVIGDAAQPARVLEATRSALAVALAV